jgi:hypothetical protein
MKTLKAKTIFEVILFTAVVLSTVAICKNVYENIKYAYGLEPKGSGISCLFEMMQ